MVEVNYRIARLRRTLLIIILATLPCYLLGMIILWVGNSAKKAQTVTPTTNVVFITATYPPTATSLPPTRYPTRTPAPTFTITPTFTATVIPSETPTEIPTTMPTSTDTEVPISTNTEIPAPTEAVPTTAP